jgi:hypothetical protein
LGNGSGVPDVERAATPVMPPEPEPDGEHEMRSGSAAPPAATDGGPTVAADPHHIKLDLATA